HAEYEIGSVALFVEHAIATGLRQNALAERAAAVGDERLNLRDRSRIAVAVPGWNLGAAPFRRAGIERIHRRIAERAGGDRRGVARRNRCVSARWRNQIANATEMARVEADVEVGADRLGDFRAEERAERHAGNPTHD